MSGCVFQADFTPYRIPWSFFFAVVAAKNARFRCRFYFFSSKFAMQFASFLYSCSINVNQRGLWLTARCDNVT